MFGGHSPPYNRIFRTVYSLDIAHMCVAVLCAIQYCVAYNNPVILSKIMFHMSMELCSTF